MVTWRQLLHNPQRRWHRTSEVDAYRSPGIGPDSPVSYIGRSEPRREDMQLVTGASSYVADLAVPGCLEAFFVRSYAAHGRLLGVDAARAQSITGTVGVFAATDLPELPPVPMPTRGAVPVAMERPSLARDKVRFVGELVAVVLAETRAIAED